MADDVAGKCGKKAKGHFKQAVKARTAAKLKTARELMDESVQNNPTIYPSKEVLAKAEFQEDVGDEALQVYQQYWDKLKTGR